MSRKDVAPRETINRIEQILREIGLSYAITSENNNCGMFFSVRVEIQDNGSIIGTNGKGMTRELALASGLAELMERLQSRNGMKFWYSTKDYPERAFVHEYVSDATIDESIKCDFDEFGNSELWRYRIDYLDAKSSSIISVPNRLVDNLKKMKENVKKNEFPKIAGYKINCYCSLRSQQHASRCTQNAFSMHFGACKSRKIAFHAILTSRNMDCEQ